MASDADQTGPPKPNPRGGRRKLPPHLRRSEKFEVRLSEDELSQLQAAAMRAGLNMSDFIRTRTLKPSQTPPPQSVEQTAALASLNRAILAIGGVQEKLAPLNNNMNQIARYLHTGRGIQTEHWLEEERANLLKVREQLTDIASRADAALKRVFEW